MEQWHRNPEGMPDFSLGMLKKKEKAMVDEIIKKMPEEYSSFFDKNFPVSLLISISEMLYKRKEIDQSAMEKANELMALCAAGLTYGKIRQAAAQRREERRGQMRREAMPPEEIPWSKIKHERGTQEKKLLRYRKELVTKKWAQRRRRADTESTAKKISAVDMLLELHRYEVALFRQWVRERTEKGKLDPQAMEAYWKRLNEGQEHQATTANINRMAGREEARAEKIISNLSLLPSWQDRKELEEVEKQLGITYELVKDHSSREFIQAYAMLRANFPPDEMDPSADLMQMLEDNETRYPGLCSGDFRKIAPDLEKPINLRYYLIIAKDRNGRVIGASDGNFIATENASSMYWAHIAVPQEDRRKGIASLVYAAALSLGNKLAYDAESAFNANGMAARYQAGTTGNKLMYFILESEPANLESRESVKLTFGRLLFHGRTTGASVIPALRYAQVDLDYDKEEGFDETRWRSVPLLLLVRRIERESETSLTAQEVMNIAEVLPLYFTASGLYNIAGIGYDLNYATATLRPEKAASIIPLPNSKEPDAQVGLLRNVLSQIGTIDSRCQQLYPGHNWTMDYLARFKEAIDAKEAMTLEQALSYMLGLERKKVDTTPPGA